MKQCIFCQIVKGQLPAEIVYENAAVVAFLDHRPLFPGHVLVVPRIHRETLTDVDTQELAPMMETVRLFSIALPRALQAQGSFVANNNKVSQSVPHLHWHIVPRTKGDGLKGFFWPRQPYASPQHQSQVSARLKEVAVQEEILDFWFGPMDAQGFSRETYRSRWFKVDRDFDEQIRSRFGALTERALEGDFSNWCGDARGRLALLILLDQFTRNLFRHHRRSFAGDERAQQVCQDGLNCGADRQLALEERAFFYLPLEHGESMALQGLSLQYFAILAQEGGDACASYLDFARRHAEIIERFGRYPHRNQALGRISTVEEENFLREPGSSFW